MVLIEFISTVRAERASVFRLMSDWANITKWDPNTLAGTKTTPGAVGVGTKYDLRTVFKGTESDIKYEIVAYDEPNKVVLMGENDTVTAQDTITFRDGAESGQTTVHYVADIRLKGLLWFGTMFVAGSLKELGVDAKNGLEKAVADGLHK